MRNRFRSTRATRILVATALLLAAGARAELGSGAETEQNRFSWHPSIRTSMQADDNTQLEEKDSNSDMGFFVLPRVELGYQGRWFDLGADLGADIRWYIDDESPTDQFYRLSGWGEAGILPGLTVRASNAWVPTPVDLGKPEDHASNLVQTNRTVADLRYWLALPGESEMTWSFQGTRLFSEEFDAQVGNNIVVDDFRADFWEGAVVGQFQMPILENLAGFVRAHVRYRAFDEKAAEDFGDLAFVVGFRSRWLDSLEFDLSGGYGLLGYATGDSDHRFVGDLALRYGMRDGTKLELSIQNRNTVDIMGNDFLETTGRIGVERHFGERTAAELAVFVSRFDNETWNSGSNLYGGVEASIRRQTSRRTQLELAYRYWNNAGSYSFDDFSQNQLTLSFSYRR